jgi:hypothetical protein
VAGNTNREQLQALRRLRRRACRQDAAIAEWVAMAAELGAGDAEVIELGADYERKLAQLRGRRDEVSRRCAELLCEVADAVGDDQTAAELLGVSPGQVRDARRDAGAALGDRRGGERRR